MNRQSIPSFWGVLKPSLIVAGIFSLFINLMLLGPIIYMLQVFDRVLASRSLPTLYMLTLMTVIALLAMTIVDIARGRLMVLAATRIDGLLGERVLRKLITNASSVGRSSYQMGLKDIATLRSFLTGNNVIAIFDSPWLLVFIGLIFLFHPLMGVTAVVGSVVLVILAWINEKTSRKELERYQEANRRGSKMIDQGMKNADVLNAMGMTERFTAKWQSINDDALQLMKGTSARMGVVLSTSKLVRQAIQVAMMGLGVYLVIHDNLSPGVMMASTILLGRAMAPVESLIGNWAGLVSARAAYGRLQPMLKNLFEDPVRQNLPPPKGTIKLEQVSLAGATREQIILRQIDFELPAGKALAIIGPSGSGKSSLAKVIAGVWVPNAGKVRIDGAEVSQWDERQLRPNFGYLPQDVELFDGSIAENIGRFDSSNSEGVLQAAQAAHAYELILKLPEGFQTQLGSGGIQLSAGQAQRVGLARALYGRPKIVILDEPNANLDADGEQALMAAIAEMKMQGSTVLLITHKPSLVSTMDYLMVMRDGRIDTMGPREEVLSRLTGRSAGTSSIGGAA